MKRFVFFALLLALGLSACGGRAPTQTIAELVAEDPQFLALKDALEFTELTTTLSGAGPFTVFAPSNEAFASITTAPEQEAFKQILLYHVIAEELREADLEGGAPGTRPTAQGANVAFALEDGKLVLTDVQGKKATVTTTDIRATNGVIHVIDAVLLPQ
jgi:transforming growth factor-beta-induced protein